VFVLAAILLPSLAILYSLDEVGSPVLTRHVTGFQWYWSYTLTEECLYTVPSFMRVSSLRCLGTDSSLVLPAGLVFRLLVSSRDVLHSFALPAFGLKADAVPGRLNMLSGVLDRAGLYYGQCSEICGSNHSFMPIASEVSAFLKG
jgi:heme/copper-type cytochrome/quinol oxidase subunit 2